MPISLCQCRSMPAPRWREAFMQPELIYEKGKFSLGAIDYYSDDIINIAYAETKMELPISPDWKPTLAAQFVDQGSVGANDLQGHSFSGHQIGFKAGSAGPQGAV